MKKLNFIKKMSFNSFLLVIFLLIIYIFQQNSLITTISLMQEYQKKIQLLTEENRNLEIVFAQNNSLFDLNSKVEELGFEKIKSIKYVKVVNDQIAKQP